MPLSVDQALRQTRQSYEESGLFDEPQLEARFLLSGLLDVSVSQLIVLREKLLTPEQEHQLSDAVARRLSGEPLGRILGWREFWGLRFFLSPATLEPRPDSETLIDAALALLPDRKPSYRFLDLGTGSGCLLGALLESFPNAIGVGVDLSAEAVQTASANLSFLGFASRARFLCGSWVEPLLPHEQFDLIISNPPYIAASEMPSLAQDVRCYDPELALTDGADGLEAYRAILSSVKPFLVPEGGIILELGATQSQAVSALAEAADFEVVGVRADYGGHLRALVLRHSSQKREKAI